MVRAFVLTGFGMNCDFETAYCFEKAGAEAARVHVNDLISGRRKLKECDILAFPGGFSFGDDLGSGKVLANKFRYKLSGELEKFVASGGLVLGVCNGFQCLVKLGLLPAVGGNYLTQQATLTDNDSGRFEDRWIRLSAPESKCVWTGGIDFLDCPVNHGEGKFVAGEELLGALGKNKQVAFRYVDAAGKPAQEYPANPNGSLNAIAGVCDPTGRVLGLMPHPEKFNGVTNHPRWTRGGVSSPGGLKVFENGVNAVKM